MSELFEYENEKRPEHCPKCRSVNIKWVWTPKPYTKTEIPKQFYWICGDCGREIK